MENIAEKFQSLNIRDRELSIVVTDHPLNIQKCLVSKCLFKESFKKPGQVVSIRILDHYLICKVYSKTVFPDNVIELNSSVRNNISRPIGNYKGLKLKISDINAIEKVAIFNELRVKVVFDSIDTIKKYEDKKLVNILQQNVLKRFLFSNSCLVSLKSLPEPQRMGIVCVEILESVPCGVGKVTSKTKIIVLEKLTQYQYQQLHKAEDQLFSLEAPIERLAEIIRLNEEFKRMDNVKIIPPTKQILLVGPSGCGKSCIVRVIGRMTGYTIVHVLGHEMNKSEPGETESTLRDTFNTAFDYAQLSGKCIINLEEVDNLCPRIEGSASHVRRSVSQLLRLLDEAMKVPGIIVIGTTNKPESIDPSIRRHGRLETELYISPPTENQRAIILNNFIEKQTFIDKSVHKALCNEVAAMTPGYVGADLQLLCNTVTWKYYRGMFTEQLSTLNFWKDEFRKVILNMSPVSLKGTLGTITTKHLSFEDLAGLENIRKSLEMAVIWPTKHADSFARMGIKRPRGVLLYGPPGCAKTSLVRALVGLGTFSLLSISAAELYSPYVGDAEQLIRQMFQRARQNSPCIFFIDEIDALAGTRGEKNQVNSEVQDRIIATLLTQMDGIGHKKLAADLHDKTENKSEDDGVIVIGATNRPDMIDAALLRPGRFDKHIFVPPPDYDARFQIFKCVTKQMPVQDVDFDLLARSTEMYSGADIKNICIEAAMIAMTQDGMEVSQIRNEHFIKALNSSRSSLTLSLLEQFHEFRIK